MMDLELIVNDEKYQVRAAPGESLFQALRKLGFWGLSLGMNTD